MEDSELDMPDLEPTPLVEMSGLERTFVFVPPRLLEAAFATADRGVTFRSAGRRNTTSFSFATACTADISRIRQLGRGSYVIHSSRLAYSASLTAVRALTHTAPSVVHAFPTVSTTGT